MSKIYSQAPSGVAERVAHLVKLFHGELLDAGVKIDLVSVSTDGEGDALKLHGYPCLAVVRVVGGKDRAKGHGDAEIVIDEEKYSRLSDAEKDALLDHEIYHIKVVIAEEKETRDGTIIPEHVVLDAQGRPKLSLRKHDADFGWFAEIAERHGAASIECKQANQLYLNHTQTFFAFVGEAQQAQLESGASDAAKRFVKNIRESGNTVTIRSGGKETTIGQDGIRPAEKSP